METNIDESKSMEKESSLKRLEGNIKGVNVQIKEVLERLEILKNHLFGPIASKAADEMVHEKSKNRLDDLNVFINDEIGYNMASIKNIIIEITEIVE